MLPEVNATEPEKRRAFTAFEIFSTADYAQKFGMAQKDAFIELARSWPHYRVWIDEQVSRKVGGSLEITKPARFYTERTFLFGLTIPEYVRTTD